MKKQNGIYNEFIIKEVSKNFSNNKILIENIPSAENIIMSGIEKKYLNIMIFNRFLWCIISLIGCIISIKYIGFIEQFSYIIYISTLILWAVIFSLTGISFKRKKYVFRDHDLMYSSGVIFTSTVLIPYNRIQHLAIHQGFLSRVFDLASLQFYTAGGSYTDISIKGLTKMDAEMWKEFVSAKIEKIKK